MTIWQTRLVALVTLLSIQPVISNASTLTISTNFNTKVFLQLNRIIEHQLFILTNGNCSGNADSVISQTGITNANNAQNTPDGLSAQLYELNDQLVLDLTDTLITGQVYTIIWRKASTTTDVPEIILEESTDGINWSMASGSPLITNITTFFNQNITASINTRFLRLTSNNDSNADLDGISYSNTACNPLSNKNAFCNNLNCSAAANEIKGQVFNDTDFDGIFETGEQLNVEGIEVIATDSLNNTVTTTTNMVGVYSFSNLIVGHTYRIEFIIPSTLSWLVPTRFQGDNGTTVQFTTGGNCANLAVADPATYCGNTNPDVLISCYETGNAVYGVDGNTNKGIISFSYGNSGTLATPSEVAKIHEVGTVWGTAWQPATQRIFNSAFTKRHTGFGSLGAGGVYVTNFENGIAGVTNSFDLQGVNPLNGGASIDLGSIDRTSGPDFTLPNNNTDNSYDLDAFDKVGKVSFGDTDIAQDGETLWLVNLNQRALISVDITDTTNYLGTVNQYLLSDMVGLPTCINGVLRPWGLAFHQGKGYLGAVCSAENGGTAADMHAYVFSFNPENPTILTIEIDFALDYTREAALDFPSLSIGTQAADWHPWVSDWAGTGFSNTPLTELAYAQPILTDIDFLADGSMVLGFADRFGFQMAYNNYIPVSGSVSETSGDAAGDIIKICRINDQFILEGTGGCTVNDNTSNSTLANDGPSNNGEFFYTDYFNDTGRNPTYNHNETFIGGLAVLSGTDEVLAGHYDPLNGNGFAFDLGVIRHNTLTGDRNADLRLVESGAVESKGNNLGDMVFACASTPIEIGNYVWLDLDRDGIQEAGEKGLAGIRIELYDDSGNLIAFDTTDVNGQYYFSESGKGSQEWINTGDALALNHNYYVVVNNGQFSSNTLSLGNETFQLTIDSTNSGPNRYNIDNNAIITNSYSGSLSSLNGLPVSSVHTGYTGGSNHSIDIGFSPFYDFGDLPDAGIGNNPGDYATSFADGGPRHAIINGLFLGNIVDMDSDGQGNSIANGDDSDGIDDEDGIIFLPSMDIQPNGTINLPISITNSTGKTAYLEAWIDWNNDGVLDAGEMVVNLDDSIGSFPAFVPINVPPDVAIQVDLGVRFRLSLEDNMTAYGTVNSGEVEDYLIKANCPMNICLPVTSNRIRGIK